MPARTNHNMSRGSNLRLVSRGKAAEPGRKRHTGEIKTALYYRPREIPQDRPGLEGKQRKRQTKRNNCCYGGSKLIVYLAMERVA